MDKASASGAGDSRFESWAGHFRRTKQALRTARIFPSYANCSVGLLVNKKEMRNLISLAQRACEGRIAQVRAFTDDLLWLVFVGRDVLLSSVGVRQADAPSVIVIWVYTWVQS